jgi:hypothetical protein
MAFFIAQELLKIIKIIHIPIILNGKEGMR